MTSLHLQHFIVQMSLENLTVFGQCCCFLQTGNPPSFPSLIRLRQSIQITQVLFLRRALPPLLTWQISSSLSAAGLMLNFQFRNV
uniref:Uncharacterized protein n=1 Tax=Neovison vison TaxID=452646 RepID=A0A8C7BD39_NEOVI